MKLLFLDIQLFAHKKGQGSTKNGRDSESKRLGDNAADGEFVPGIVEEIIDKGEKKTMILTDRQGILL